MVGRRDQCRYAVLAVRQNVATPCLLQTLADRQTQWNIVASAAHRVAPRRDAPGGIGAIKIRKGDTRRPIARGKYQHLLRENYVYARYVCRRQGKTPPPVAILFVHGDTFKGRK